MRNKFIPSFFCSLKNYCIFADELLSNLTLKTLTKAMLFHLSPRQCRLLVTGIMAASAWMGAATAHSCKSPDTQQTTVNNSNTNNTKPTMKTAYDFSVKDRKGKDVSLREYANEVILIVNTATKCGFTPQYEELEDLYKKYHSQGFEILDFPCNQFGQQAPGTDDSIHEFCKMTYGTDFPRFKKVKVNGDDADELFKWLKSQKGFAGWDMSHPIAPILDKMLSEADPNYKESADIKWNFTKFLISKKGLVVARFEPTESIENVEKAVVEELGK